MSLLIKGMDIPKNCDDCRLRSFNLLGGMMCCLVDENVTNQEFAYKRHPNCPLSEISTPHGRLIGADALLSRLNGIKYAANVEDWISRKPIFADGLEEEIISAPTIIEAEEEQ